jgi:DNA-binding CsgD family transcriptional regulator
MGPGHLQEAPLAPGVGGELLEREEALSVLEELLVEVGMAGQGRLVLIGGEAGIGKTALVRRFSDAQRPPVRVLWGACEDLFAPRALGPFVDLADATGGELEELVERGGRPHEVLSALTREVAGQSPTVIVLEDLHWADEATLDVLRLLGRRVTGVRALVLGTYRDDQLDRLHPLRIVLGELATSRGIVRLDVAPLSREAVAQLADPYDVDAEELYRTTGGNAFFVSEALMAGTKEIPPTVRDAVLARTAHLSVGARSLLDLLSVAPPEAEPAVLEAIAGGGLAYLDECLGSGMVVAAGRGVRFRHELERLVIEESLPPDQRVTFHTRTVGALRDSSTHRSDPARLAHHAEGAWDPAAVLRFAPEAAKRASALGAHRESATQYARALRFADSVSPEQRAELLERRAYECMVTDQVDAAIDAGQSSIELRRRLGDVRGEGRALEQLANVLWCPGRVVEARDAAQQAVVVLEQIAPSRELAMAYSRMAQLCMDAEDTEGAVTWGDKAVDLAEALGETELAVHALSSTGTARLMSGEIEGKKLIERSRALATETGLDGDVSRALVHLAWTAQHRREYACALDYLEEGLRYASDHGWELFRGYLLAYKAKVDFDLGRWQDSLDTAALVLREPRRSRIPRIVSLAVTARVRARRGDPEVWPLLDEALSLAEQGAELQADAPVAIARAETHWLQGEPDRVEEATAGALELARLRRSAWAISELASWRRRAGLGDHVSAEEAAGPYALEIAGYWPAAAAQWRELGCPYEAALALAETDDQDTLRQALDQLRALGATPAEALVARRLRKRGARGLPRGPRPQTRANPAGLTARELEVLPLLAQGMRNAQIAERLIVSERTVDHHVSAILRKLGVRTRGEASAEAARLRLIDSR